MRFVIVGTMVRGALERPEDLGEQDQVAALSALRMDASRDVRVEWERGWAGRMAAAEERAWKKPPAREKEPSYRTVGGDRLMRLASGRRA